ncbi:4Fe-4S binding protein [Desulfonatronovibrio magnus]|uniref:4Fe-4S binding protein n=1 Tax=Desulfonatronovibrio magnus TaxID=698827 RepID=UPI000696D7D6|nr:4Fe-4S binding protein [Desulfonatronovibrio magnus]
MNFRVISQGICLIFFLYLLFQAAFPLSSFFPADTFLRLDPLISLGTMISSRAWIWSLFPGFIILGLTLILGRFFCGYVCPMGTTIDLSDRLFKIRSGSKRLKNEQRASLLKLKFYVLFFILGAGILSISWVFSAAPLSLITRLYGLIIYPVLIFVTDIFLDLTMPFSMMLGLDFLTYAEPQVLRFATQWFIAAFFGSVMLLVYFSPRFWCRYLCPSGAMMALLGRKPLIRRHVSSECTHCGMCEKKCPMNAIQNDPFQTVYQECIVCQTCVRVCPEQAVNFKPGWKSDIIADRDFIPSRRRVIAAAAVGAGSAIIAHTGIAAVKNDLVPGNIMPHSLIRPPGAVLERDFQSRCVRCGLCMKACPTNTLQPVWLEAGLDGIFSPKMLPRRGPCEVMCNVCGHVCPTGAIRALSLEEKMWARVGTSYVIPYKCLAWEWDRECLVCYEVCPYAAIELKRVDSRSVPVPYVLPNKCSGCGACEYHCPVQAGSAIIVEPMEALRMNTGSYIETGRAIGMDLEADPDRQRRPPDYLFDPQGPGDLPPGFSF